MTQLRSTRERREEAAQAAELKREARERRTRRILELASDGLSFSEIARALDCNNKTVRAALVGANVKAKRYDGLPHGPPC